MAKQTFTTGQVLTAAQMTNLQQTALGGGSPVQKTASYVLTAADAGTTIQMNSAGTTTVTVNTGLFAAGDTVFIQNIGAGVSTITAGTATVTTAGSLALTQWEGGTLYFTSASAAIFFDYIQAGVSIPLTTKGDVLGFDTAIARIPIGANDTVLTADSTQALGLKWASPSSAKNFVLLNAGGTALSGTTTTVSGISAKDQIFVVLQGHSSVNASAQAVLTVNSNTANYNQMTIMLQNSSVDTFVRTDGIYLGQMSTNANSSGNATVFISGCNSTGVKIFQSQGGFNPAGGSTQRQDVGGGTWTNSATITSVSITSTTGSWDAGTIYVYTTA